MKKMLSISALIFAMCSANSQTEQFKDYLDSFEESHHHTLGNFRFLVNNGKNMSKEHATKFVYHNDTSRLYCHFQAINMETEERGELTKELYLPQKCLKLTTATYTLIGYSTFKCSDPNVLLEMFLTLKIIEPSTLRAIDSLVVYQGNEYDWNLTGLINPQNNKIFAVKQIGTRQFNAQAFIYKINDSLKFEIEHQQMDIKQMTDDLEKAVGELGWGTYFFTY